MLIWFDLFTCTDYRGIFSNFVHWLRCLREKLGSHVFICLDPVIFIWILPLNKKSPHNSQLRELWLNDHPNPNQLASWEDWTFKMYPLHLYNPYIQRWNSPWIYLHTAYARSFLPVLFLRIRSNIFSSRGLSWIRLVKKYNKVCA